MIWRVIIYLLLLSFVVVACNAQDGPYAPAGPVGVGGGGIAEEEGLPALDETLTFKRRTTEIATATATRTRKTIDDSIAASATPEWSTATLSPTATSVSAATGTSLPGFHLCSPLNGYQRARLSKIISDPYKPPPPGSDDRHQGVDFVFHRQAGEERSILGVGVQAVMFGTVAAAVRDSFPYGNLVIVETPYWHLPVDLVEELGMDTGESLYHLYGHMQEDLRVELGQRITSCQVIGTVGASGNTEAPHLHFETRIGPSGQHFPVMSAFIDGVTGEQRANYVLWRTSMVFAHFDPMILMDYGTAN